MPTIINSSSQHLSSKLLQPHWNTRLQLAIAGVNDLLRVVKFTGEEAISSLYQYSISIACENPALSLNRLIGSQASFLINGTLPLGCSKKKVFTFILNKVSDSR